MGIVLEIFLRKAILLSSRNVNKVKPMTFESTKGLLHTNCI